MNELNQDKVQADEYPNPPRFNNQFFFGYSMLNIAFLVAMFIVCNGVISPIFSFLPQSAKIMYINYGPTFLVALLLREDVKTGESVMTVLWDFLLYEIRPKEYIYRGSEYHKIAEKSK